MHTPTPTAEPLPALGAVPYGGAGGPPIDVDALARMAQQFFAALPGQPQALTGSAPAQAAGGLPVPSNPLPAGVPSGPLPQPTTTQFGGLGAAAPGLNLVPSGPDQIAALARPSPNRLPHAAATNGLPDVLVTAVPGLDSHLGGPLLGVPQSLRQAPSTLPPGLPSLPAVAPAGGFYFLDAAGAPADSDFYFIDTARHPGPHGHHGGSVPDLAARSATRTLFDVNAIRRDFPILAERVNGKPLVWFDNAATTQKPTAVIERLTHFYEHENSNVHRAAHTLAARATDAYEKARATVARFLNAGSAEEIVWVRGCTEGINLIAKSWGAQNVGAGDEIVVSHLEHHANIVPWQQLAAEKGAVLRVIPVDDTGQIVLSEYQRLLGPKTKLVSITHVSNALGTVVPVHEVVQIARSHGITTIVDGAQSVSHMAVDVQAIGCDFFVFSGHKVFGPTGIGAVYGRRDIWEKTPPWQGGGNMIADVTFERTIYQPAPARYEAGTGNIADAAGLGAALEYVERIGLPVIARYEHDLLEYATAALKRIPGLRLIGTASDKASVASFVLQGYEPAQVGQALSEDGIAVRSGHHCAQPILRRFGVEATVRPSFAFYNTCEEIDRLVSVVRRLARA